MRLQVILTKYDIQQAIKMYVDKVFGGEVCKTTFYCTQNRDAFDRPIGGSDLVHAEVEYDQK